MNNSYDGDRDRRRRFSLASSGLLTALILAAVLGTLGIVWAAHLRGKLHKLSTVEIPPETTLLPRPGGQDIIELHRLSPTNAVTPEFVALTAMPGSGMGILQLVLDLPGHDPQDLLQATPIASMAPLLDLKTSVPKPSLQYSPISLKVFPLQGVSDGQEILGTLAAQNVRNDMVPGGTGASADFPSASVPGPTGVTPPPSGFQTKVSATISDRGFDLTLTAKNVSPESRELVLSWTPKFLVPTGGLDKFRMTPPDTADALPSERKKVTEIALIPGDLPKTWSGLKYSYLSAGSEVRLHNLADSYTLRMIALTPSIRTIKAELVPGGEALALTFSTEGADGKQTVVEPGETLQWRLRIQAMPGNTYVPPGS